MFKKQITFDGIVTSFHVCLLTGGENFCGNDLDNCQVSVLSFVSEADYEDGIEPAHITELSFSEIHMPDDVSEWMIDKVLSMDPFIGGEKLPSEAP